MASWKKYGREWLRGDRRHRLCALGLICLLLVLLPATVHGTLAYLHAGTHVENTFTIAEMRLEVKETFDGTTKKDVKVENTGDAPAYLRAALAIYWKDEKGAILSDTPVEGTDYTLAMGSSGWIEGADGFWYYPEPVEPAASTTALIGECKLLASGEDGRTLCVDVLTQAVQASPTAAVEELWGATVAADGVLTPPVGEVSAP